MGGGLAALSLQSLGPVDRAGAGWGVHPSAPSTANRSPGAVGAAAAPVGGTGVPLGCDAGASAALAGAGAGAGAAPGLSASTSPGAAAALAARPSERPAGGDELSAEAAASPFSPPATERHAAFLKLVDSATKASLMRREQRCADFSALAAEAGVPLVGNDRCDQARALANQSFELAKRGPAGFAEAGGLRSRAWVVLVSLSLPVLQSRIDKDTSLLGKCRPAEEAYQVYTQQLVCRVTEQPEQSTAALKPIGACVGYDAALNVAHTALNLLLLRLGNADQRDRTHTFVLSVLGLIPHTARLTVKPPSENHLVDIIDNNPDPSRYHPDFWASLQALWRSPAANVLRSRGALQGGIAARAAFSAEFDARQATDLAKRGLRACALLSCGKLETTVLQFRVCGHCQRMRYCCAKHAKQHWPAHKRKRDEGGQPSGGAAE